MAVQTQRISRQFSLIVMLLSMALLLIGPRSAMAGKDATEYHVKAVFLYNLVNFVMWPEQWHSKSDFFIIGIFGDDPFGDIIDIAVAGEQSQDKPMRIVRYAGIEELRNQLCDILFISSAFVGNYEEVRNEIKDYPILTVSDSPGFSEKGGMVNLVKKNQQVELVINRNAVIGANLFISSKLLRLAKIVE
jgi:hypothetical protein